MSPELRDDDLDRLRVVERDVGEVKVEQAKHGVILERIDARLARRDKWIAGIASAVVAGLLLFWLTAHQAPARADDDRTPAAQSRARERQVLRPSAQEWVAFLW